MDKRRVLRPRAWRHRLHSGRPHIVGKRCARPLVTRQGPQCVQTPWILAGDGYVAGQEPARRSVAVREGSVESVELRQFGDAYHGRRVLLTGHTGFKGSWLALWLRQLGANVTGLSLAPPTAPNHWD